jgi:butyryl-CoA dehydrogenase
MGVYAIESALLRTQRLLTDRGIEATRVQADITRIFTRDTASQVEKAARAVASETEDQKCSTAIDELSRREPMKAIAARRRIADAVIQAGKYHL